MNAHAGTAAQPWWGAALENARKRGDPDADQLAQALFSQPDGHRQYSRVIRELDQLAELSHDEAVNALQALATQFSNLPPSLWSFFAPQSVPETYAGADLALAAQLWERHSLGLIQTLYASSLPHCYLLKDGLTALYETHKLAEEKFIYQRLYETGLFVEAVASSGGLRLAPDPANLGHQRVWGKGFLFTRQVRLMHAAMRRTLANEPNSPWKTRENLKDEVPINQEDIAYTLGTFARLAPVGLVNWGCYWTPEEETAYLDLWRIVGWLLGLEGELIPGNTAQADEIFRFILADRKPAAGEENEFGIKLTEALLDVFADYLPAWGWLQRGIPPLLMCSQMNPDDVKFVLSPARQRNAANPFARLATGALLLALRIYYFFQTSAFRRFPSLQAYMSRLFARTADAFIESWRDEYYRIAFDPTYFQAPAYQARERPWRHRHSARRPRAARLLLQQWRRNIFYVMWCSLALFGVSLTLGAAWLLALLLAPAYAAASIWGAAGCLVASILGFKVVLPAVVCTRPDEKRLKRAEAMQAATGSAQP